LANWRRSVNRSRAQATLASRGRRSHGPAGGLPRIRSTYQPPRIVVMPRKRESNVVLAPSPPHGVIPAHAGIQWRGVRSEARRSLSIALRFADRVSSSLRPAEQGESCLPNSPLASPQGHPGKSPRALPVRAVPGKRRPREGRQTTRASMPSNSLAIPLARAPFPGDFQGPRVLEPAIHGWLARLLRAEASTSPEARAGALCYWIPACAGMTPSGGDAARR